MLCEQLGVNPSTVLKWCTNSSQPDLQILVKIARLLKVTVDEYLLNNKIGLQ
ncbi:helix-turn-helix transcriptional regulator [uncultured Prevotella sp.]|uniref:helix-turn-helix transcriptional regulator n=1 Tax=uncultured Prevotella sp. TaxID=159272 RepID=UPI002611E8D0|nr:helix-turn-helix transcriptional regulator [uncultured Prevotella sp.]